MTKRGKAFLFSLLGLALVSLCGATMYQDFTRVNKNGQVSLVPNFPIEQAQLNNPSISGLTLTNNTLTNATVSDRETWTETTAPSGTAGAEVCYGDAVAHALKCSYNNGTFGVNVLDNSTNTLTNKTLNSAIANGTINGSAVHGQRIPSLSISAPGAAQGQQFTTTQTISQNMGDALFRCIASISGASAGSPFVIGCVPASATSVSLTMANGSAVQSTVTAIDVICLHD